MRVPVILNKTTTKLSCRPTHLSIVRCLTRQSLMACTCSEQRFRLTIIVAAAKYQYATTNYLLDNLSAPASMNWSVDKLITRCRLNNSFTLYYRHVRVEIIISCPDREQVITCSANSLKSPYNISSTAPSQ
jgi:hypothetical protein